MILNFFTALDIGTSLASHSQQLLTFTGAELAPQTDSTISDISTISFVKSFEGINNTADDKTSLIVFESINNNTLPDYSSSTTLMPFTYILTSLLKDSTNDSPLGDNFITEAPQVTSKMQYLDIESVERTTHKSNPLTLNFLNMEDDFSNTNSSYAFFEVPSPSTTKPTEVDAQDIKINYQSSTSDSIGKPPEIHSNANEGETFTFSPISFPTSSTEKTNETYINTTKTNEFVFIVDPIYNKTEENISDTNILETPVTRLNLTFNIAELINETINRFIINENLKPTNISHSEDKITTAQTLEGFSDKPHNQSKPNYVNDISSTPLVETSGTNLEIIKTKVTTPLIRENTTTEKYNFLLLTITDKPKDTLESSLFVSESLDFNQTQVLTLNLTTSQTHIFLSPPASSTKTPSIVKVSHTEVLNLSKPEIMDMKNETISSIVYDDSLKLTSTSNLLPDYFTSTISPSKTTTSNGFDSLGESVDNTLSKPLFQSKNKTFPEQSNDAQNLMGEQVILPTQDQIRGSVLGQTTPATTNFDINTVTPVNQTEVTLDTRFDLPVDILNLGVNKPRPVFMENTALSGIDSTTASGANEPTQNETSLSIPLFPVIVAPIIPALLYIAHKLSKCKIDSDCKDYQLCRDGGCIEGCSVVRCGYKALCVTEWHMPQCHCFTGYHGNPANECIPMLGTTALGNRVNLCPFDHLFSNHL